MACSSQNDVSQCPEQELAPTTIQHCTSTNIQLIDCSFNFDADHPEFFSPLRQEIRLGKVTPKSSQRDPSVSMSSYP